jgi:hypothetical protein
MPERKASSFLRLGFTVLLSTRPPKDPVNIYHCETPGAKGNDHERPHQIGPCDSRRYGQAATYHTGEEAGVLAKGNI